LPAGLCWSVRDIIGISAVPFSNSSVKRPPRLRWRIVHGAALMCRDFEKVLTDC
jgi:hypothetical protein